MPEISTSDLFIIIGKLFAANEILNSQLAVATKTIEELKTKVKEQTEKT